MSGLSSLVGIFVFFVGLLCIALLPIWKRSDLLQRRILIAVVLMAPLLAYVSYDRFGAYADLSIRDEYQRMLVLAGQGLEIPEDDWLALVDDIKERAEDTDKAEYWYLLAGIYEDMQNYEMASNSYQHAAEIYSDDAGVLSRWTETEFIAQGYNLTPKVQQLAERVLAMDPRNATVLGVLGIAAFQAGDAQTAIEFWTRALQGLPADSENSKVIQASIMLAQQELAAAGVPVAAAPESNAGEAVESEGIPLAIRLASGIDVDPATTLFIIARIPGSPMPTAVTRLSAGDLPLQISLDNSMAMIPGTNLMNLPMLEVVVRLSFSGQPAAQSGDYEVIKSGIVPTEIDGPIEVVLAEQIQ